MGENVKAFVPLCIWTGILHFRSFLTVITLVAQSCFYGVRRLSVCRHLIDL